MSKALGILPLMKRSRLCSAARTVLAKEGDFPGSNYQRHKSNAATSLSSDIPSSPRGRKRVSMEERRALVESYVNEYRKRNSGKFPTAKDAIKHAGGGYYFVRKIIQELEYASKSPQLPNRTIISAEGKRGDVDGGEDAWKHTKEHSKKLKEDLKDQLHGTELKKLRAKKVEKWEVGSDVGRTDDLRIRTEKLEESDTLEAEQHVIHSHPDPEVPARRKDDGEYSGETSFWGSLKTFAGGIISIWRRK